MLPGSLCGLAALTIDAEPAAVAADAMALATVTFDRTTVSRDHPRAVHTVRFDAPFGPPAGDLAAGSLLRVIGTASDGEQPPPFRMIFRTPEYRAYEMPVNGATLYDPFYAASRVHPARVSTRSPSNGPVGRWIVRRPSRRTCPPGFRGRRMRQRTPCSTYPSQRPRRIRPVQPYAPACPASSS